jgi:hypothetical protein
MKRFIYVLTYRHWSNFKKKKNSYIYRSFCLLDVSLICWSFNLFANVHIDRVNIDQCFQSRRCFAFNHRVDRVVDFMYSFYFRDLSSLVWLSKTHDVYHETLLLCRVEFYQTVVQRFRVSTEYQRYEAIENRRQRCFESSIEIEIVS